MQQEKSVTIKIINCAARRSAPLLKAFLERPAIDAAADKLARRVLAEIKTAGDPALAKYIKRFDGVVLAPSQFRVQAAELRAARSQVDAKFKLAAKQAHQRIKAFAQAGLSQDWLIPAPQAGMLGERFTPLDRVGVYIPGGSAPLVSSALMTVSLAQVAGVPAIMACSPVGPSRQLDPYLLYALELAGATEIYKIGGIQAIAAMAYGTATIRPAQKIVGPGGPYVTAAKRCVYGDVALDLVAGPSEIAILADASASAELVAADLLSQAEHGTGHEKCLLVTTSLSLAQQVRSTLLRQARSLSRWRAIRRVLQQGTLLVVVRDLHDGMELCNRFAPEHLELIVRQPRRWLTKVKNAGAIFVGAYTPECVGDFVAGPSHVLPTGGTAAMFSGLTSDDFRKRSSVIVFSKAGLQAVLPTIEEFGRVEGLDAHARSARLRFAGKKTARAGRGD